MKSYFIRPAHTPREVHIQFSPETSLADIQRGSGLAGGLHARPLRNDIGWIFTPSNAQKWQVLFDRGYELFLISERRPRYRMQPGERLKLFQALQQARCWQMTT